MNSELPFQRDSSKLVIAHLPRMVNEVLVDDQDVHAKIASISVMAESGRK